MELMKNRLNKMSTASAIGSDMLSNDDAANDYQRGGSKDSIRYVDSTSEFSASYNKGVKYTQDFQSSVAGFIGDIQKRLG